MSTAILPVFTGLGAGQATFFTETEDERVSAHGSASRDIGSLANTNISLVASDPGSSYLSLLDPALCQAKPGDSWQMLVTPAKMELDAAPGQATLFSLLDDGPLMLPTDVQIPSERGTSAFPEMSGFTLCEEEAVMDTPPSMAPDTRTVHLRLTPHQLTEHALRCMHGNTVSIALLSSGRVSLPQARCASLQSLLQGIVAAGIDRVCLEAFASRFSSAAGCASNHPRPAAAEERDGSGGAADPVLTSFATGVKQVLRTHSRALDGLHRRITARREGEAGLDPGGGAGGDASPQTPPDELDRCVTVLEVAAHSEQLRAQLGALAALCKCRMLSEDGYVRLSEATDPDQEMAALAQADPVAARQLDNLMSMLGCRVRWLAERFPGGSTLQSALFRGLQASDALRERLLHHLLAAALQPLLAAAHAWMHTLPWTDSAAGLLRQEGVCAADLPSPLGLSHPCFVSDSAWRNISEAGWQLRVLAAMGGAAGAAAHRFVAIAHREVLEVTAAVAACGDAVDLPPPVQLAPRSPARPPQSPGPTPSIPRPPPLTPPGAPAAPLGSPPTPSRPAGASPDAAVRSSTPPPDFSPPPSMPRSRMGPSPPAARSAPVSALLGGSAGTGLPAADICIPLVWRAAAWTAMGAPLERGKQERHQAVTAAQRAMAADRRREQEAHAAATAHAEQVAEELAAERADAEAAEASAIRQRRSVLLAEQRAALTEVEQRRAEEERLRVGEEQQLLVASALEEQAELLEALEAELGAPSGPVAADAATRQAHCAWRLARWRLADRRNHHLLTEQASLQAEEAAADVGLGTSQEQSAQHPTPAPRMSRPTPLAPPTPPSPITPCVPRTSHSPPGSPERSPPRTRSGGPVEVAASPAGTGAALVHPTPAPSSTHPAEQDADPHMQLQAATPAPRGSHTPLLPPPETSSRGGGGTRSAGAVPRGPPVPESNVPIMMAIDACMLQPAARQHATISSLCCEVLLNEGGMLAATAALRDVFFEATGDFAEGLLSGVERGVGPAPWLRAGHLSAACDAAAEESCAPPSQLQAWGVLECLLAAGHVITPTKDLRPAPLAEGAVAHKVPYAPQQLAWLDAARLTFSPGWPLRLLLSPDSLQGCSSIFSVLQYFRVATRLYTALYHTLIRRPEAGALVELGGPAAHRVRLLQATCHSAFQHVRMLQIGIHHQILETCWRDFTSALERPGSSMMDLCAAHDRYVQDALRASKLLPSQQNEFECLREGLQTFCTEVFFLDDALGEALAAGTPCVAAALSDESMWGEVSESLLTLQDCCISNLQRVDSLYW